tara:strand:- start:852 stop:1811 length:960 start_codon:yes stop_codon:yes gene_type:complete
MLMSVIATPFTNTEIQTEVGFTHVFAQEQIRQRLSDSLSVLPIVQLVGDVAGSGSDVVRISNIGGIGYNQAMATLGSENATITASAMDLGYSEVTVAMYGLAYEETYKAAILAREPSVLIDNLVNTIPDSWLRQLRDLVCTSFTSFATTVGSSTLALSMDDYLDLVADYREALGSKSPAVVLAPKQYSQLLESARSEPAMNASMGDFSNAQRFDETQTIANAFGLGADIHLSDSVDDTLSVYSGGAFSPGGIGFAVGGTGGLVTASPATSILIPEFGLVVEDIQGNTGTRRVEARAFFGVNAGSTDVYTFRKIQSASNT